MSQTVFKLSSYIRPADVTHFIVDTTMEDFDLSEYTKIKCIEYKCNNIPVLNGISRVKRVIINNIARNMKNLVKADHYVISAKLLHHPVFKNASTLEIIGDKNNIVLDNIDHDNFPNLIGLKLTSVIVDLDLLKDISKIIRLATLEFDLCPGLDKFDWSTVCQDKFTHLIGLKIKSVHITLALINNISNIKTLVSLHFKSCGVRVSSWDNLDLPKLHIFFADVEFDDVLFLEKCPYLTMLTMELADECKNLSVFSKLPLRYLNVSDKRPKLVLGNDIEMLYLHSLCGNLDCTNMAQLKMFRFTNDPNNSYNRLNIASNVVQIHSKLDGELLKNNQSLWIKAYQSMLNSIMNTNRINMSVQPDKAEAVTKIDELQKQIDQLKQSFAKN